MTKEYWIAILKEEDRLIDNSDRKYRYHCKSLESMSEELAFQERYIGKEEDFTILCDVQDFTCLVQNEELAAGLRRLTDRQRQAIRLRFWEGYQCQEIAAAFPISQKISKNFLTPLIFALWYLRSLRRQALKKISEVFVYGKISSCH